MASLSDVMQCVICQPKELYCHSRAILGLLNKVIICKINFQQTLKAITRVLNTVPISGSKVLLILASQVVKRDVITVVYIKASTNPLQTTSGEQAASLSDQIVTNNVPSANPIYVSYKIENSMPSLLEMSYNVSLASKIHAATAFIVPVYT